LDLAEDRGRFSELLELTFHFQFGIAETADEACSYDTLDFPLLIRPSYVLGGQE
jgi:carbamoyl-phosphate synthase large subunit